MAEMIPDRLPDKASRGEGRIFALLKGLEDDCIVYYEPVVSDRYPDFVLIIPDLGLLVIEVKGWWPKWIESADDYFVQVKDGSVIRRDDHPVRQANGYKTKLMNCCTADDYFSSMLCHAAGEYKGKLKFPFGHLAYLSNISSRNLEELGLQRIFPEERVITKDRLESWADLTGKQLKDKLKPFFGPFELRSPLSDEEVNAIRAIIHPEIVIQKGAQREDQGGPTLPPESSLKVLDLRQEELARKIKTGHRILNGVAGSGKTVLLISRARLLSESNEEAKILVLCFNRALSKYLNNRLSDCRSVQAVHFHAWAKQNGVEWHNGEANSDFGKRLLTVLENGGGESRQYDAVLIDEAQDFEPEWFKCVREALKEPDDGDLIIVADGNQGLYKPTSFKWKDVGIKAAGRVLPLRVNYRNTWPIMQLASAFADHKDEDPGEQIVPLKPLKALRKGPKPLLFKASHRIEEHERAVQVVTDLLRGEWAGEPIPRPLTPSEIGIVYPLLKPNMRHFFTQFRSRLADAANCPIIWLTNREDPDAMMKLDDPGIKIVTIHSAKGLQFRAVIFLWADLLPKPFGDPDIPGDKRLMYVGLTRAEEFLAVTYSRVSEFTKILEESWPRTSNP